MEFIGKGIVLNRLDITFTSQSMILQKANIIEVEELKSI